MHFIGSALLERLSLWEQRRRPPPAALPSQALRASSPKGRALGKPVKFPLDAQSLFVSWTVVPCCIGQRPCPLRRFAPAPPEGEPLAGRSTLS